MVTLELVQLGAVEWWLKASHTPLDIEKEYYVIGLRETIGTRP